MSELARPMDIRSSTCVAASAAALACLLCSATAAAVASSEEASPARRRRRGEGGEGTSVSPTGVAAAAEAVNIRLTRSTMGETCKGGKEDDIQRSPSRAWDLHQGMPDCFGVNAG